MLRLASWADPVALADSVSTPTEDRRPASGLGIAVAGKQVGAALLREAFRVWIKAPCQPIKPCPFEGIATEPMIARQLNPVRLGVDKHAETLLAGDRQRLIECRDLGD